MRCNSVLIRLDEFRTGELEVDEQKTIKEHLGTCASCDESLEEIETLSEATRQHCQDTAAPRGLGSRCEIARADRIDTELGPIWVAFGSGGIRMLAMGTRSFETFSDSHLQRFGRPLQRGPIPESLRQSIDDSIEGGSVDFEVDHSELPSFDQAVLQALLKIPRGEVRSYAWVAKAVGKPRAVRAVGNACAKNPTPIVVPCHRVVPSSGGVGNYALGMELKRTILEHEGVDLNELDDLARRRLRYVGSNRDREYCFPTCAGARTIEAQDRIYFRDDEDAIRRGFRPCNSCTPLAYTA